MITTKRACKAAFPSDPGPAEGSESRPRRRGDLPWPTLDAQRQELERTITRPEYTLLLRSLHQSWPQLSEFPTWQQVVDFMRTGSNGDPRKNDILLAILTARQSAPDRRWNEILLAIYHESLQAIHARRFWYDDDERERWQVLVLAFLEILDKVDVAVRSERLVHRLYNDTLSRFYDEYERIWIRARREVPLDYRMLEDEELSDTDLGKPAFDRVQATEAHIRYFHDHMKAGRITEEEYHLLVNTRVLLVPMSQYARDNCFDYGTLRKRRQRVEAKLEEYERLQELVRGGGGMK